MDVETIAVPTVLVFRDRFWLDLVSHCATSRPDLLEILGSATGFTSLDSAATAGADLAIVDAWIFGPQDVQALRIARELYPRIQFVIVIPPRSSRDTERLRTAGAAHDVDVCGAVPSERPGSDRKNVITPRQRRGFADFRRLYFARIKLASTAIAST